MSNNTHRLAPALCLLLAACSGTNPNPAGDAADAESLATLEVPPGLDLPDARGSMPLPEGGESAQAPSSEEKGEPDAVLHEEGNGLSLLLNDGFARAWRRAGIALDAIGLVIDDRDRSSGIYYVTVEGQLKTDAGEEGWFSGLFQGGENGVKSKYQVKLGRDGDESTPFTVLDENGATLSANEARPLLEQLRAQFNR